MSPPVHFAFTYHLPSWQGGDVVQPLCLKPLMGSAGRESELGHRLTTKPGSVTCCHCKDALRLHGTPWRDRVAALLND